VTGQPTETCVSCRQADIYCVHDLTDWPLARLLAAHFQETDEPTDEQASWYLDDANAISGDVGTAPWMIQRCEPISPYEAAFQINGVVCVISEGGKDCPASAQAVCKVPVGQEVADAPPAS
jgi:hypothetical protein